MKANARKTLKHKAGQNTAEYLIMLVLVAVGSIGMISVFGQSVKNQFKNAIASLEGDHAKVGAANSGHADEAETALKSGTGMNIKQDEVKRFSETAGNSGTPKK